MKICFVGHSFHERTKSTSFIIDILRGIGDVEVHKSSPDLPEHVDDDLVSRLIRSDYDLYVFLQTEYIAAKVVPFVQGRCVLVPMYDGASSRPDEFWRQFLETQFLSFSRNLHETLQRLQLNTSHFQFALPVPGSAPVQLSAEQLIRDGFFWHRRPDTKLNASLVLKLCERLGIHKLHIREAHDLPDTAGRSRHFAARYPDIDISFSTWSSTQEEYLEVAGKPVFFFAPRLQEGIGLSFLEAMARGQIVVAPDLPTMNEYLRDGVDGLLYDPDDITKLRVPSDEEIRTMSRQALRKARTMHEDWSDDQERLRSHILGDERRWATTSFSANFMNKVSSAAAYSQRQAYSPVGRSS